jgi:hypothetical protein
MLVRCLHAADKQRRVAVHGYDSRIVRVKDLLEVAGRYRLAVRVQAEEDGEYIAPHVLVNWYGKVTQAGCMNMVTEIQGKRC